MASASLLSASPAQVSASPSAWALFNGYQHAMGGLVIRLAVTAGLALTGVGFALLLGLVGGLFPALRAARMPVADAPRAIIALAIIRNWRAIIPRDSRYLEM